MIQYWEKNKQDRLKKGQVMKDSLSQCSDFMSTAEIKNTQHKRAKILFYITINSRL